MKKLGEILMELGALDANALAQGLQRQAKYGNRLGRCLVELKLCDEEAVVRALSRQHSVASVNLAARDVSPRILRLIPARVAREHRVVPLAVTAGQPRSRLTVAMAEPWDLNALDTLEFATGFKVLAVLAGDRDVDGAIDRFYPPVAVPVSVDVDTAEVEPPPEAVAPFVDPIPTLGDLFKR